MTQSNRAKLREIVFKDPDERRWLNSFTHPLIRGIVIHLQNAKAPPFWFRPVNESRVRSYASAF